MFRKHFIISFILLSSITPVANALSLWSCASHVLYREQTEAPVPTSIRHTDASGQVTQFEGSIQLVRYEPRHLPGLETVYEYRVVNGECPPIISDRLKQMARGWTVTRHLKQQEYLGPGRGYRQDYRFVPMRFTDYAFETALMWKGASLKNNGERVEYERHHILLELRDTLPNADGISFAWETWIDVSCLRPERLANLLDAPAGFLAPDGGQHRIRVTAEE